jgi:hypothetical protein
LNEVLYIIDQLSRGASVDSIGRATRRHPQTIRFKFLEYRPINSSGQFIWNESVKTEEEVYNYVVKVRSSRKVAIDEMKIKNISNIECGFTFSEINKLLDSLDEAKDNDKVR